MKPIFFLVIFSTLNYFGFAQCGDVINPTASNPITLNVECIADVPTPNINIVIDEADNSGTTPIVSYVSSISDGNTCPETISVIYGVTDTCGNMINVTHIIIVNDNTNPTASNPDTTYVATIAEVPAPNPMVVLDETDNCTVNPFVTFVSDVSDGNLCPEIITRTYGVMDDCGNQILLEHIIVVGANPNFTIIGNSLVADMPGQTYQWLDCDNGYSAIVGATSQTYIPSVNGNYVVEVTTLDGCVDTAACQNFVYSEILQNVDGSLIVYPNPTNDLLFVQLKSNENASIQLLNMEGKVVLSQFNCAGLIELDVNMLEHGIYVIKISSSENSTLTKFVKH